MNAEGKVAMLQTKARARQLTAKGLGKGYLTRNLSFLLRGYEGSSARAIHCGVEDSRPKKTDMK